MVMIYVFHDGPDRMILKESHLIFYLIYHETVDVFIDVYFMILALC